MGHWPGTEVTNTNGVVTADGWLMNLMRESVVAKAYWVGTEPGDGCMFPVDEISFSDLPISGYDLIFACRSDWGIPPHLDDLFNEYIVTPVLDAGFPVMMEPGVDIGQYTQKFREDVKNLRRQIDRGKGP